MSDKLAILVLGPESSATRWVTRTLVDAGLYGDGDHWQRLDYRFHEQVLPDRIVWRRSLPYGDRGDIWPDLDSMYCILREREYAVKVLSLLRASTYCALSQVARRFVPDQGKAEQHVAMAMRRISSFVLENGLECRWLTYEGLISDDQLFARTVADWGIVVNPQAENGNAKYRSPLVQ